MLDLVHTNICSMTIKILDGVLYFVTFIDDYSRKLWIFTLRSKDQVFDVFKEFHPNVERRKERKLRYIQADNDGEYRGLFERYCRQHGIRLEKTILKIP